MDRTAKIFDLVELRERVRVFRDRAHAGEVLAGMLGQFRGTEALVLAIPAGGYPVAREIAGRLGLSLDVAVVSKVTPSWDTEVGYGALAFDRTLRWNEALAARLGITEEERRAGADAARRKVERRLASLRGGAPFPDTAGKTVFLVDDGLASGLTMLVAIEAIRRRSPGQVLVAVPTGHADSVARVGQEADAVYCANVRSGPRFAVAQAYRSWRDVSDEEIAALASESPLTPDRGNGE